tara:strand:+ start:686 stop:880 length:195 start_codon:yes stop_codon:yes gene_type:complete
MRKVYKKLTKEQKDKGVIFSSELIGSETIHEVKETDDNQELTIRRLLDDSFFNKSPYSHNEVRK